MSGQKWSDISNERHLEAPRTLTTDNIIMKVESDRNDSRRVRFIHIAAELNFAFHFHDSINFCKVMRSVSKQFRRLQFKPFGDHYTASVVMSQWTGWNIGSMLWTWKQMAGHWWKVLPTGKKFRTQVFATEFILSDFWDFEMPDC
jgi:hypothetical protein